MDFGCSAVDLSIAYPIGSIAHARLINARGLRSSDSRINDNLLASDRMPTASTSTEVSDMILRRWRSLLRAVIATDYSSQPPLCASQGALVRTYDNHSVSSIDGPAEDRH